MEDFAKKEGVASTFEEDSKGDQSLLALAQYRWFKVYLVVSIALSLSETFLVAFPSTRDAQIVVLAASSVLFLFGYGASMYMVPLEEGEEMSIFARFRAAFLPEVWIELFGFAIGWGLIFQDLAMASLRCFRIFRFVWYSEFYRAKKKSMFFPFTFFSHIVLQYLEKLGKELFTVESKGGVVVLGFFFYMAYVMGVSFWQKTADWALTSPEGGTSGTLSECDTLPHCFLIMLRLTFFDGSGFDFLKSIMDDNQPGLVTLLVLYMCVSALVLLNGLIGIFGGTFASATEEGSSDDEEEDEDEEGEEKGEKKEKKEKEKKGDGKSGDIKNVLEAVARVEELCMRLQADVADLKGTRNNSSISQRSNG